MKRQQLTTRQATQARPSRPQRSRHTGRQLKSFCRQKHDLTRCTAPDSHTSVTRPLHAEQTAFASRHRGRLRAIFLACTLALAATSALLAFTTCAYAARAHGSAARLNSLVQQASAKAKKKRLLPAIKMKLVGTSVGPLLTDGARWAVYEPVLGTTRIIDTATGETINRPDPEGCSGGLESIGGGEILYECGDPECPGQARACFLGPPEQRESRRYEATNVVRGTQSIIPGTNNIPVAYPGEFKISEIGSQWAWGTVSAYRWEGYSLLINLRDGELVSSSKKQSSRNEQYNLNQANPIQLLCPPLTRPEKERIVGLGYVGGEQYEPILYSPPFGLVAGYLRRCRSTNRMSLSTCGPGSVQRPLGGGVLACGEDFVSQVFANQPYPWHGRVYRLASRRPGGRWSHISHTATMVFASVPNDKPDSVYFARLPWAHSNTKATNAR